MYSLTIWMRIFRVSISLTTASNEYIRQHRQDYFFWDFATMPRLFESFTFHTPTAALNPNPPGSRLLHTRDGGRGGGGL